MSRVVVTGGHGFLGWHVRTAALAHGLGIPASLPLGAHFDADEAARLLDGADHLVHLAGVNRASDDELVDGNVLLAEQTAQALRGAARRAGASGGGRFPTRVTFAGSTQAGNGSHYAVGKERAARILRSAALDVGADFVEAPLPNLFGEHGRPGYNSVVATFADAVTRGEQPTVVVDRELTLLHAQAAADVLLGVAPLNDLERLSTRLTVSAIRDLLVSCGERYATGEIPALASRVEHDLFNTLRAQGGTVRAIPLSAATDPRGSFVELVRSGSSAGQTSFSTTAPGIVRGDHFHRRKIERFVVVGGSARIRVRRLLTADVQTIDVSGDQPTAVDIPTLAAHSIENTGSGTLSTVFWCADLFDPSDPDTFPEHA